VVTTARLAPTRVSTATPAKIPLLTDIFVLPCEKPGKGAVIGGVLGTLNPRINCSTNPLFPLAS
jgi:hypothetical protein